LLVLALKFPFIVYILLPLPRFLPPSPVYSYTCKKIWQANKCCFVKCPKKKCLMDVKTLGWHLWPRGDPCNEDK